MDRNTALPAKALAWIVSDGRRGIENQPLGLGEALARQLVSHDCTLDLDTVHVHKDGRVSLPSTPPDLWLGCGRAALKQARRHRRIFPSTYFVYVQDPRHSHDLFDLIIAPSHDRLRHDRAIAMLGSPNRVTPDRLREVEPDFVEAIAALPDKKAAVLIGGPSKRFRMPSQTGAYLVHRLKGLLDQGLGLMVTVSRRTPQAIRQQLAQALKDRADVVFHDGTGANPYFSFLSAADWVFVTEESTNMLVEAAVTGAPVYALSLPGEAGKFSRLHAALSAHGAMKRYLGTLEHWSYTPLNETPRIAAQVIDRWTRFRQLLTNDEMDIST